MGFPQLGIYNQLERKEIVRHRKSAIENYPHLYLSTAIEEGIILEGRIIVVGYGDYN
jgi:hypothetical protein